ncbi:MAG: hypothetical protein ACRDBE_04690 [Leuconostoc lactis]
MTERTYLATKVPAIGLAFWATKLITTGLGESWSDFFNQTLGPVADLAIGLLSFGVFLFLQFRQPRYRVWTYWLTLLSLAIFGTFIADTTHGIGISYVAAFVIYGLALIVTFVLWYRNAHNLSVHTITTNHRELFYWATVTLSFTLGTAVGDWLAESLRLGFLDTGVYLGLVFLAIIAYRQYFGYHWQHGMLGSAGMSLIWLVGFVGLFVYLLMKEGQVVKESTLVRPEDQLNIG